MACLISTSESHAWRGMRGDGRSYQQLVLQYSAGSKIQQWLAKYGQAFVRLTFEEATKIDKVEGFGAHLAKQHSAGDTALHDESSSLREVANRGEGQLSFELELGLPAEGRYTKQGVEKEMLELQGVRVRLLGSFLWFAADSEHRQFLHLQGCDRIQHVDLDLLPLACAFTVQQRGKRPFEGGIGRHSINKVLPRRLRWFALAPR